MVHSTTSGPPLRPHPAGAVRAAFFSLASLAFCALSSRSRFSRGSSTSISPFSIAAMRASCFALRAAMAASS
eukprot:scaffold288946_cov26-Tisochrysis_lutea.AAC.1